MTTDNDRTMRDEAWRDVSWLIAKRNKLLHSLARMASAAANITPGTGMLVEFDDEKAQSLLDDVAYLAPRIEAGVRQANQYARRTGQREMRCVKLQEENE